MEKKRKKSSESHLPQRGPKLLKNVDNLINTTVNVKSNTSSSEKTYVNEDETKILQIDEHQALFSIESPRHTRSLAIWEPSKKEIQLKRQIGKMFQYFGTQTKHNYTLLPEEAVFLLEMNYLELQWNTIPLSIQQAYALLLNENELYCKLRHYRMYSQLLRDGYRMIRHKNYEKNTKFNNKTENKIENPNMEDECDNNIKPLIDNSINNIDEALKRLEIFNKNDSCNKCTFNNYQILYDGFHPKRKFCKSNTSSPDICICYASSDSFVPTVHYDTDNRNNSSKLLFGLKTAKNVVFYNVQHITVKNLN